jgi:hypothetical protein
MVTIRYHVRTESRTRLVFSKTKKKMIGVAVVAGGLAALGAAGTMSAHAAETHGPFTATVQSRGDQTRQDALFTAAMTCLDKFGDRAVSQPVKIEYFPTEAKITFNCTV